MPIGALAEDVLDEEEEEPQSRRNRPPKQRGQEAAEPVERQQEEREEKQDAGVVELALPIGEPVRITGRRGKKPKKHYSFPAQRPHVPSGKPSPFLAPPSRFPADF
jgi:hypothetical protein